MAIKQYFIGSQGPYTYDDAAFPGAIDTTGTIRVGLAPTDVTDVLRLDDVGGGGPAAPSDASYVVVALDADLSAERTLVVNTTNLTLVDGGTNGNITINTVQNINITATPVFDGLTLSALPTGIDNTVLISFAGIISTDEIDPRVWGSLLVDYTGTPAANQITFFADVNTIQGSNNLTFLDNTVRIASMPSGVDNSVVIIEVGGRLKHDEIDPRVWGSSLVDFAGSPANNQIATFIDGDTIQGESLLIWNGSSMGIGTVSPSAKLEVYSTITGSTDIRFKNTIATTGDMVLELACDRNAIIDSRTVANTLLTREQRGSGGLWEYQNRIDGGEFAWWTIVSGSLLTEKMRLTDGGDLGIGTSSPGANLPNGMGTPNTFLEVSAPAGSNLHAGIGIRKVDDVTGLDLWINPVTAASFIDSRWDSGNDKLHFRMRTAGTPVNAMTIDAAGRVGIGTVSPAATLEVGGTFSLDGPVVLTIAAGAITVTNSFHKIDTEGGAATDDLTTINGGVNGMLLILAGNSNLRDVTLKDASVNLHLAGDFTMANANYKITLIFDDATISWHEVSRSAN